MKIVHVSSATPLAKGEGGIPRALGSYLDACLDHGDEVWLVASNTSKGGAITPGELRRSYPRLRPSLFSVVFNKKWGIGPRLFAAIGPLAAADLAVIHGIMGFPSVAAAWLCRSLGVPYVVVAHGQLDNSRLASIRERRPLAYRVATPLMRRAARGASAVVLSGRSEQRALVDWTDAARHVFIPNFFRFDRGQMNERPPRSLRDYVFVGRIEPDKGIRRFLEIWRGAASEQSRFIVIGSGTGAYFEAVQEIARSDERITLTGELPREDVYRAMRDAAAVVLPTGLDRQVTENFGLVVVEALIQGRPALVTEGLHWDEFADNPAIYRFGRSDEEVAQAILKFEALTAADYKTVALAAQTLALNFHEDRIAPTLFAAMKKAAGSGWGAHE